MNEETAHIEAFRRREPHGSIISTLEDNFADSGAPYCPREFFTDYFSADETEKALTEKALDELIAANIIVERSDPHTAGGSVAMRAPAELHDAEYDELKASVYRLAQEHGLRPKWLPDVGWRLVGPDGRMVTSGNMLALKDYLENLGRTTPV